MLLQLFKERYASVYRAFIPVPTEKLKIKTAREKLNGKKLKEYSLDIGRKKAKRKKFF